MAWMASAAPVRGGSSSTASSGPSKPRATSAASPAISFTVSPASSALRRSSASAGPALSTAVTARPDKSGRVKVPLPQKSSRRCRASPSARKTSACRRGTAPRFACAKVSGRARNRAPFGSGESAITGSPSTSVARVTPRIRWCANNLSARLRRPGVTAPRRSTAPFDAPAKRPMSVTPGRSPAPRTASANSCRSGSKRRHSSTEITSTRPARAKPHSPCPARCIRARRRYWNGCGLATMAPSR